MIAFKVVGATPYSLSFLISNLLNLSTTYHFTLIVSSNIILSSHFYGTDRYELDQISRLLILLRSVCIV